jgi:hypothetical protein
MGSRLEPQTDVSVGDWIAARLRPDLGTVGAVVPDGFPAYARVLHPVEVGYGRPPLTWAQVCRRTGRIPHALMQWAAITRGRRWDDGDVQVGNLAPATLGPLLDVLAPATGDQDCLHALWDGWGWLHGTAATIVSSTDDVESAPPRPAVPADVLAMPRLRLPDRDHLLFRGPLRAALDLGRHPAPDWFLPQSPSLLWPADRSWCVGTEIDFDSTLVGGSADLVDAVLAAPGLDSWPVGPDGDLTAFADLLNAEP